MAHSTRTLPACAIAALALAATLLGVQDQAQALDAGDWLVRLRGIAVLPQDSSGPILPALPTAGIGVGDSGTGEVDFTYMVTENIGAELILASPHHDLNGTGSIAALGQIGDTRLLPPVLTLQYHFLPKSWIRPYLGIGVNYTIFYDEHASNSLAVALGGKADLTLDNSVGVAGQVGVDIDVADNVFLNLDVKYVDLDTVAHVTAGALALRSDVHIDPIVVGVGVGMRF
ncbi:MAG: OmpW family protein [Alphaproteobacteria bacterium]